MSKIISFSPEDDRLEQASRWVLKLDSGFTAADRKELRAWFREDPENLQVFLEVANVWEKTDELKRLADLFPLSERVRPSWVAPRYRRPVWAASIASVLLAVAALWYFSPVPESSQQDSARQIHSGHYAQLYETVIGEQSRVALPDGTVLTLNTNSQVDVAYSDAARILSLKRGEIHLEVAEDPARPLSVLVGNKVVQAVGTAFSIEISEDEQIQLVVTEGKVLVATMPSIEHLDSAQMFESIAEQLVLPSSSKQFVTGGEKLTLGDSREIVTQITPEEIEVKLSWRDGRLIFRSEPLESALKEVERYTTVQFVLLDDELKRRTVSGRFKAGDVETLLHSLRMNFDIVHEVDSDGRILLDKQ